MALVHVEAITTGPAPVATVVSGSGISGPAKPITPLPGGTPGCDLARHHPKPVACHCIGACDCITRKKKDTVVTMGSANWGVVLSSAPVASAQSKLSNTSNASMKGTPSVNEFEGLAQTSISTQKVSTESLIFPRYNMPAVQAVGNFVEQKARRNGIAEDELKSPSFFHAVSVPEVPLVAYLHRLQKICHVTDESLYLALIYVDRLIRCHKRLKLNMLTVHRLALAATVIAAKFFEDIFYTNSCYAKVGGVSLRELNVLENYMLEKLDFRLYVNREEFESVAAYISAPYKMQEQLERNSPKPST